jgi:hypothetical protein
MRVAFDRVGEKKKYVSAVESAVRHGFTEFSNYMLYNWKDTPKDLYERLVVNIKLNQKWQRGSQRKAQVYSYPMRFAPIDESSYQHANRSRDYRRSTKAAGRNWLKKAQWTPKFVRNIEIMKGAAHGAITPTPSLAWRTIGADYQEFLTNLYMPEALLRNRNKHEKRVYGDEPNRKPGDGKVEEFRAFMLMLLEKQDDRFRLFHEAVAPNSKVVVNDVLGSCKDREIRKWLRIYAKR